MDLSDYERRIFDEISAEFLQPRPGTLSGLRWWLRGVSWPMARHRLWGVLVLPSITSPSWAWG